MKNFIFTILFLPLLLIASEEEEFKELKNQFEIKDWNKVINSTDEMIREYPESVFLKELYFFRGIAFFHINDPDLANKYLDKFLQMEGGSSYFEEALKYKYFIAEKFENGYYGHLFGVSALPRIESMWDTAYQLYDEVIMTLPRHEIAAKALFRKASMYREDEKFDESIETFNMLIRKFPKNYLAQKAYIEIAKTYEREVRVLYLDPKCFEFAMINQKRFHLDYPSSKLKKEMEDVVVRIIDLFAEDVYKSALYFDKKNKIKSAIMYLKNLITKYPKSKYAILAMQKITSYDVDAIYKQIGNNESSLIIGSE